MILQSPENIWEQAAKKLSDEDRKFIDFDRSDKRGVLEDLVKLVNHRKQLCMEKRWKYRKGNEVVVIRDQLEKITTWIDRFKRIGDAAVQYDPVHASLPWAGVRFLLEVAINDCCTFGAMVEGVEKISKLISRYAIFARLYLKEDQPGETTTELKNALLELYAAVLRYLSKARRYFDKSTPERIFESVIQPADAYMNPYMLRISEAQDNVDRCADLVKFEEQQHSDSTLKNLYALLVHLEEPMTRSAVQLSELHDHLEKSERKELFKWLSTVPHRTHHKTAGRDVLPESGLWLRQYTNFIEWRSLSVSSILWLHGIPGSGKTKLVHQVNKCLMEDMQRVESPAPISYFYCTRNPAEPQRADPDEILRSILRQLCSSKAEQPIREPVAQIFKERKQEAEEDGSEPIKLTGRDCVEAIVSLLERNPATIIIDALDECEPSRRHKLLDALDDIILRSFNVVKIIVSSRDDNDIVCNLARSPNIYISAKDNSKDIERYVKTEVRSAIEQKRILRGEISSELESIDCLQIDRRGARDVSLGKPAN